ncbi:unnamed protein product [Candidula unifasciata]|uniref:Kinase n=1 Tax=Candidula unifasciata TaxID=100452 RepID=A0A8S3YYD7_9EUPU|nr:unnamed protein product [Candidula unifasciata]
MINQNIRNRIRIKESDKQRERSKSAHSFKNSQFYAKYLFFENARSNHFLSDKTSSTTLCNQKKELDGERSLHSVYFNSPRYGNFSSREAKASLQTINLARDSNKTGLLYSNSVWRGSAPTLNEASSDVNANATPAEIFATGVGILTPKHSCDVNSIIKQEQANPVSLATNNVKMSATSPDKPDLALSLKTTLANSLTVSRSRMSSYNTSNEEVISDLKTSVSRHDSDILHSSNLKEVTDSFSKSPNSTSDDLKHPSPSNSAHTLHTENKLHKSSKLESTSDIIHGQTIESPKYFKQQSKPAEDSGPTSERRVSTAKITLKHPHLPNQKEERRIYVIETCPKPQHKAHKASPRLNEWLKSVIKLHNEQKDRQWSYPEDETIPSEVSSLIDVAADSDNTEFKTVSSNTAHLLSLTENPGDTSQPQIQCVSIGINTDISLSKYDLHIDTHVDLEKDIGCSHFIETERDFHACGRLINKYGAVCSNTDAITKINNRIQHRHNTAKHFQTIADYAVDNMKDNRTEGNQVLESSLCRPQISIHVTDEEDPTVHDVSSLSRPTLNSTNTSFSCDNVNEKRQKVLTESSQYMYTARGPSPHYMFPCGHLTWDDAEMSNYLTSPRNSICSNSSLMSYKSSNADSAVDLGPTDDDHDFEYADFLARYQARRFSHPDRSLAFSSRPALGDTLASVSVNRSSSAEHIPFCAGTDAREDLPQVLNTHGYIQTSLQTTPLTNISNCSHELSSLTPGPYDNDQASHSEQLPKRSDTQYLDMQNTGFDYSPKDPYNMNNIFLRSGIEPLSPGNSHVDETKERQEAFQDISDSAKAEENTLFGVVGNPALLETPHQEPRKKSQFYIIPELIISDHSDANYSKINARTTPQEEGDVELQLPSRPTSSLSSEYSLFDCEESGFARSLSVSSLCSIASTCSTCSQKSESSDLGTAVKKQSSWKKIRSFILWSPFVQVFKKHKYPWIQLAGHQGNFHAGEAGSVLKKLDKREQACFQKLMTDPLKDFVPEYRGNVVQDGENYIQLEDLLCSFNHPCVMDVKMGIRTYLENELHKARLSPTLRKDMYQKMIEIDSAAPTPEEREQKAVTKARYMQWRDEMSSSVQFGFRVEGIKKSDGNSSKDFKKTRTRDDIVDVMKSFIGASEQIAEKYINRLKEMMATQETSDFFLKHEIIGSSILFVHDADENVGVWMIDFGKTQLLPPGLKIDHRSTWREGNHEDGYLFGLDNLISVLEDVHRSLVPSSV